MIMNRNILIIAIMLLPVQQVLSQEWGVPPDQSILENPLAYNIENINLGKELYARASGQAVTSVPAKPPCICLPFDLGMA